MGLFDAGEFVGGNGCLVGFIVVVGHGYVYSGTVDGDGLHVDGSGKGIIYYYTLADGKQFEIGRELFALAHGIYEDVLLLVVVEEVVVVVLLEGVVKGCAELVFKEVMLGGVDETSHRVEMVDGIAGSVKTQFFGCGDNHDVLILKFDAKIGGFGEMDGTFFFGGEGGGGGR